MLFSMTGYGQSQVNGGGITLNTDIQCLNSRFLDLSVRLPRALQALESVVRQRIPAALSRGKIFINVTIDEDKEANAQPRINTIRLRQYQQLFREIKEQLALPDGPSFSDFAALHDLIEEADEDRTEVYRQLLEKGLGKAITEVKKMQEAEGANLATDMTARLDVLREELRSVMQEAETHRAEMLDRYRSRIQELLNGVAVDEGRLLQEVAVMAEKRDIAEECIRLESHLALFDTYMESEGESGKKLGFLLQEMGREVNTIGSKSNQIAISHTVVRMKDELEKIREQVQNIL